MPRKSRILLGLALLLAGPAAAGAADGVFGRWLVEDGKAVIELRPCGAEACGRIVWLRNAWEADGSPKRDENNPDPAARMRPLCGLGLISGLEPGEDGAWEDGEIYSTRDGRTYGLEVTPDGPDRLSVRGYLGVSLLGDTQTWARDGSRRGDCTTMRRSGSDR